MSHDNKNKRPTFDVVLNYFVCVYCKFIPIVTELFVSCKSYLPLKVNVTVLPESGTAHVLSSGCTSNADSPPANKSMYNFSGYQKCNSFFFFRKTY